MPRVVDGVKKFNVFAVAVSVAGSSPSDERIVLLRAKARMTHAEAMNLAVWILTADGCRPLPGSGPRQGGAITMTTRVPLLVELHGKLAKLHELQIRSYAVIWGEVPEAASVYDVVLCTRCHEVAPLARRRRDDHPRGGSTHPRAPLGLCGPAYRAPRVPLS